MKDRSNKRILPWRFESPHYSAAPTSTRHSFIPAALGGGMSSRLFQEIRERRGLCYTIYAQAGAYADTRHDDDLRWHEWADQVADLARLITVEEIETRR